MKMEVHATAVTYTLLAGSPLTIGHYGEPLTLVPDEPRSRELPPVKPRPAPDQPPHRRPNAQR